MTPGASLRSADEQLRLLFRFFRSGRIRGVRPLVAVPLFLLFLFPRAPWALGAIRTRVLRPLPLVALELLLLLCILQNLFPLLFPAGHLLAQPALGLSRLWSLAILRLLTGRRLLFGLDVLGQ